MGVQAAGADVTGLSRRQATILEAIRRAITARGVGPTVREITAACGLASLLFYHKRDAQSAVHHEWQRIGGKA
ncbi:MAG: hypothetical protein IT340_22510 [Chloroflexi bacterium]|nr:hypothetical protein [Chloroflexota bacterium]